MSEHEQPPPPVPILPYATPESKKGDRGLKPPEALVLIVLFVCGASMVIVWLGGPTWPAAAMVAALAAVPIAMGYFLLRQ